MEIQYPIKKSLQEMFSSLFVYNIHETKEEYRSRVSIRMQELCHGTNCTLGESINFKALNAVKASTIKFNIGEESIVVHKPMTDEEIALKDGSKQDYAQYLEILYFKYFDEERFISEKTTLWKEAEKTFQSEKPDTSEAPLFEETILEQEEQKEKDTIHVLTKRNRMKTRFKRRY